MSDLLTRLEQGVVVWDGATGTQIQEADFDLCHFILPASSGIPVVDEVAARHQGKPLEGCPEVLNLTRPEFIRSLHEEYLAAGADIVETNSFGCTSVVLAEYDAAELVWELSLAAARLARAAADEYSSPDRPRFVAGSLGPGTKLPSLGQATWQELESTYRTGFLALLEGGVDALLLETVQDLLMLKAGVVAAEQAMAEAGRRVPVIAQVTVEQTGTLLVGSDLQAALNVLESFPVVTAVGMNCATGPLEMAPYVRQLAELSTRPISIQPNAGLPVLEKGQATYKLTPEELLRYQTHFVKEYGVAMVGGCCGTTPEHIRLLAKELRLRPHGEQAHWQRVRKAFPGFDFRMAGPEQDSAVVLQGCSSLYQFVPYVQQNSILIIGEKTNANGSKAFRQMLAAENWDGLTELAQELEAEGSHVLDVCTAYVGRDEERDMRTLLARYNRHITVPIMVDSTEPYVIEASLQTLAGKPIVNSVNLEDGGERLDQVLRLCRKYGAAVVALTIDETGMAKTAEAKVAIAERLLGMTRVHGIPDFDVFLDCLTFTLGSGDEEYRNAGHETLKAIRELRKRYPLVHSLLGVSNISFGLKPAARLVLNSVFLHLAVEAGLTSAIVHYSKIRPQNRIDPEVWKLAEDLVFDRRVFETV